VAHSIPTDTSEQELDVSKEILETDKQYTPQSCVERIEQGPEWKIRIDDKAQFR
jgi:hypothetical protein